MSKLILYHTGFEIIKDPKLDIGRKNADFGQGFYLSRDIEFSKRWAKERKGTSTHINKYELLLDDLKIKEFNNDKEWFNYIFKNRNNYEDIYKDYDVIIGPIANDTLFDTFGIITSGYLNEDDALRLLNIGNIYKQITIKTSRALENLKWIDAFVLNEEEIKEHKKELALEAKEFQKKFSAELKTLSYINNILED